MPGKAQPLRRLEPDAAGDPLGLGQAWSGKRDRRMDVRVDQSLLQTQLDPGSRAELPTEGLSSSGPEGRVAVDFVHRLPDGITAGLLPRGRALPPHLQGQARGDRGWGVDAAL